MPGSYTEQDSDEPESQLLKGGSRRDLMGDYYEGC